MTMRSTCAGAVEMRDASGDFSGSGFALNERRIEEDVQAGVAAIDDIEKVANDSAGGRGNDADTVRETRGAASCGQDRRGRALPGAALSCSKAICSDPAPTGSMNSATSCICPRCSYTDTLPRSRTCRPSAGRKRSSEACVRKRTSRQLGVAILQREVDVARRRGAKVGDFALPPKDRRTRARRGCALRSPGRRPSRCGA